MSKNEKVIRVDNISKRYRIGLKENMHDTLAKTALNLVKKPFQKLSQIPVTLQI